MEGLTLRLEGSDVHLPESKPAGARLTDRQVYSQIKYLGIYGLFAKGGMINYEQYKALRSWFPLSPLDTRGDSTVLSARPVTTHCAELRGL